MSARAPWFGKVVDAHGHLGGWFNFLVPETGTGSFLAEMDRCGVRMAGVSHLLAVGPDALEGNRLMAEEVRRHPDRLFGYAVVNPWQPASLSQARELLAEPGIRGLKLHPDTHAYPLDGPSYNAAFGLAAEHQVPVLSHSQGDSSYAAPERFGVVARRHPGVTLLMGHSGLWPDAYPRAVQVAAEHPNVVLELSGGRMSGAWVARFVAEVGADRVMYGSDAIFLDLRYGLGRVALAPLDEEQREFVLFRNLLRVLGERP
ncbi:MAG: amidohydrolase family protein [Micromonosporaceae bacterium]